mgnify:FL=1
MNTLIFGLLAIISLFMFVKLGKIKASTKQLNRGNRIRWTKNQNPSLSEDRDNSKIAREEPEKISDQSKK